VPTQNLPRFFLDGTAVMSGTNPEPVFWSIFRIVSVAMAAMLALLATNSKGTAQAAQERQGKAAQGLRFFHVGPSLFFAASGRIASRRTITTGCWPVLFPPYLTD